jgi:hypothetical protein
MPLPSGRAVVLLGLFCAMAAAAGDPRCTPHVAVTLRNHVFVPSEIVVPTGKPVILTVTQEDAEPEEFESSALKVEKVIGGGSYATIRLRPLAPGRYPFIGEFHPDRAMGVVVAQ